jgi:hypothetical protein
VSEAQKPLRNSKPAPAEHRKKCRDHLAIAHARHRGRGGRPACRIRRPCDGPRCVGQMRVSPVEWHPAAKILSLHRVRRLGLADTLHAVTPDLTPIGFRPIRDWVGLRFGAKGFVALRLNADQRMRRCDEHIEAWMVTSTPRKPHKGLQVQTGSGPSPHLPSWQCGQPGGLVEKKPKGVRGEGGRRFGAREFSGFELVAWRGCVSLPDEIQSAVLAISRPPYLPSRRNLGT